jgi:hypothetical protein
LKSTLFQVGCAQKPIFFVPGHAFEVGLVHIVIEVGRSPGGGVFLDISDNPIVGSTASRSRLKKQRQNRTDEGLTEYVRLQLFLDMD